MAISTVGSTGTPVYRPHYAPQPAGVSAPAAPQDRFVASNYAAPPVYGRPAPAAAAPATPALLPEAQQSLAQARQQYTEAQQQMWQGKHPNQQQRLAQLQQQYERQVADIEARHQREVANTMGPANWQVQEAKKHVDGLRAMLADGGRSSTRRAQELEAQARALTSGDIPFSSKLADYMTARSAANSFAGQAYGEKKAQEKARLEAELGLNVPDEQKTPKQKAAAQYLKLREDADYFHQQASTRNKLATTQRPQTEAAIAAAQARYEQATNNLDTVTKNLDARKQAQLNQARQNAETAKSQYIFQSGREFPAQEAESKLGVQALQPALRNSQALRGLEASEVVTGKDGSVEVRGSYGRSVKFTPQQDGSLAYPGGYLQRHENGQWVEERQLDVAVKEVRTHSADGKTIDVEHKTRGGTLARGRETVHADGTVTSEMGTSDDGRASEVRRPDGSGQKHSHWEIEEYPAQGGFLKGTKTVRAEYGPHGSLLSDRQQYNSRETLRRGNNNITVSRDHTQTTDSEGRVRSTETRRTTTTGRDVDKDTTTKFRNGRPVHSETKEQRVHLADGGAFLGKDLHNVQRHSVTTYDKNGKPGTVVETKTMPKAVTAEPDLNGLKVWGLTTPQDLVGSIAKNWTREPVSEQKAEQVITAPDGTRKTLNTTTYSNPHTVKELVVNHTGGKNVYELKHHKNIGGQAVTDSQVFFEGNDKNTITAKHSQNHLGWVQRVEEAKLTGTNGAESGQIPENQTKTTTGSDKANLGQVRDLFGDDAAKLQNTPEYKRFASLTHGKNVKVNFEATNSQFKGGRQDASSQAVVTTESGQRLTIQKDAAGNLSVSMDLGNEQSATIVDKDNKFLRVQRDPNQLDSTRVSTGTVGAVGKGTYYTAHAGFAAANFRTGSGLFGNAKNAWNATAVTKGFTHLKGPLAALEGLNLAASLAAGDAKQAGKDAASLSQGAAGYTLALDATRKAAGLAPLSGNIATGAKVFGIAGSLVQAGYGIHNISQGEYMQGGLEIAAGVGTGAAIAGTWAGSGWIPGVGWGVAIAATLGILTWGALSENKVHDVQI